MYTCTKCGSKDMRHYCMNCEPSLGSVQQELADLKKLANKYFELKQQPVEPYWKYIHSELARVTNELQQACGFETDDSKEGE